MCTTKLVLPLTKLFLQLSRCIVINLQFTEMVKLSKQSINKRICNGKQGHCLSTNAFQSILARLLYTFSPHVHTRTNMRAFIFALIALLAPLLVHASAQSPRTPRSPRDDYSDRPNLKNSHIKKVVKKEKETNEKIRVESRPSPREVENAMRKKSKRQLTDD